jgi:hypothetical protein
MGNFEQPAHGLPANADKWASVMGDDGYWTQIVSVGSWVSGFLFILATDADA